MSKKKVTLTVRPEPPSFSEIERDIDGAHDDDVVFSDSNYEERLNDHDSCTDRSQIAQKMSPNTADMVSAFAETTQPDVDAVYQEAIEFIKLAEDIKTSPEQLRTLHDRLRQACSELSSSVDLLKHQVEELQAHVRNDSAV